MSGTTEAFSRVKIDALLTDADWNPTEDVSVPFQYALDDSTLADNVLYDRADRPMAALEAEGAGAELVTQDQGRHYAGRLSVP